VRLRITWDAYGIEAARRFGMRRDDRDVKAARGFVCGCASAEKNVRSIAPSDAGSRWLHEAGVDMDAPDNSTLD
jgi:hypothetical protein